MVGGDEMSKLKIGDRCWFKMEERGWVLGTVRRIRRAGERPWIRSDEACIDNGDPDDGNVSTNGLTLAAWVPLSGLRRRKP
jgi:hypothetical protein